MQARESGSKLLIMPAAAESLEIRESVKIGRGGHLYKNGAMPAVPM